MVTLDDIRQARERIKAVAIHTPLLPAKFGLFVPVLSLSKGR